MRTAHSEQELVEARSGYKQYLQNKRKNCVRYIVTFTNYNVFY